MVRKYMSGNNKKRDNCQFNMLLVMVKACTSRCTGDTTFILSLNHVFVNAVSDTNIKRSYIGKQE